MVKMRRDESVTTSLRELAALEEQREQDKKRAHAAAVQAAELARQRAEREAAQAEEERRRAEARLADERVRQAQQEAARRAAVHDAELEETRHRLRMQEAELLHRQALDSARAMEQSQREGRKQLAFGFALGTMLAVALASVAVFGYALPRASRAEAQVLSLSMDQSASLERAKRDAARVATLEAELARAIEDRNTAQRALDTRVSPASHAPGKGAPVAAPASRTPKSGPPCLEGDPMCGTLPGQKPL
jgi:hypothetical protein